MKLLMPSFMLMSFSAGVAFVVKVLVHALLLLLLLVEGAAAQGDVPLFEVSVNKFLMGTKVETTARHARIVDCKKALVMAYQEMARVEALLSSHDVGSEISKINRAAGVQPVVVSDETFAIVQRAKVYGQRLDGLFDMSIGPVSDLWGFNHDGDVQVPNRRVLAQKRDLVDYRAVVLDSVQNSVFVTQRGAKVDLGAIAKGYAIDRGVAVLKDQGIRHFLLNAGGDIYVSGQKDAQTDWRVGVKHPRQLQGLIARFHLKDYAVATSGDYERFCMIAGQRYHHILDPRTGYPGTLSQSATVLAPTAEEADVLSTYLFLVGADEALKQNMETPFLIVNAEGVARYSDAFKERAEMMD
ncbi:MAG: FAD:protein FMN transferase [Candidatus Latescibacteria bacterium]|jgi:FAD:protein FMN transferase|nr:FAD:protein FMN transferase [Candidatus Latescibacterota bacterium]MBT4137701.1 FAD:protein FMN transferase [Candidatus Latescibacterota bacterium]MBT5831999.1 FAD:protein FMN transferase [Candidatus Latescibacterota bacterium]